MSDSKYYDFPDDEVRNIACEPAVAYLKAPTSPLTVVARKFDGSEFDKIAMIRKGVDKKTLLGVAKFLGVTIEEMSDLLHISPRTLQRKKDSDRLGPFISERVGELVDLSVMGEEVLGSLDAFRGWLRDHAPAFYGKAPIDLLDTSLGCQYIKTMLGRLAHGVYS